MTALFVTPFDGTDYLIFNRRLVNALD